jgi:hypothetical protein
VSPTWPLEAVSVIERAVVVAAAVALVAVQLRQIAVTV